MRNFSGLERSSVTLGLPAILLYRGSDAWSSFATIVMKEAVSSRCTQSAAGLACQPQSIGSRFSICDGRGKVSDEAVSRAGGLDRIDLEPRRNDLFSTIHCNGTVPSQCYCYNLLGECSHAPGLLQYKLCTSIFPTFAAAVGACFCCVEDNYVRKLQGLAHLKHRSDATLPITPRMTG